MFTITTWNILADRYSDVYNSVVEKDVLLWSNRIKGIIKKIKELNSDILCLQEVELSNVHVDFIELFSDYDFVKHEIDKKRDNLIGNMILWKKEKFVSLNTIRHSCAVHTLLQLKNVDDLLQQKNVDEHLNKALIWITNVHLKAGLSSGETMRVSQIKSCLEKINKWKKNNENGAGVICGDFNDKLIEGGLVFNELKSSGFEQTCKNNLTCMLRNGELFNFDHIIVNSNLVKNHSENHVSQIYMNAR